jgi:hypothetical protein
MKQGLIGVLAGSLLFAAMPASSNYGLHNYGFGSGGTSSASSSSYKLNATTGEVSGQQASSTTYKARSGNQNSQQSNVPPAPTFTNPSNYYNKLQFVVSNGSNPTDTKFSIAISTDNFVTTKYVQTDDTIGNSKSYQTYAAWGGAAGQLVTGLQPNTTYQLKVNAIQGNFTETEYGPSASAATVAPTISFDIDVSAADTETAPPYATSFGSLLPGTVTNTPEKVWIDIATNANSGAFVYVASTSGGLFSSHASFTLASATADLSAVGSGYGAQGTSATQSSGGPLSTSAPFNVSAQNVGLLSTTAQRIFTSSAPITGGRGSFQLKAKAAAQTPSANDYKDTLTLTAVGVF